MTWTVTPAGSRWLLRFAGVELAAYAGERAAADALAALVDAGRVPGWLPEETNPYEPEIAEATDV